MRVRGLFRKKNDFASATLIEALISIGVVLSFVSLFFFTFNDIYDVYDRPDIDLDAKADVLIETFLGSSDSSDSSDLDILNLGNSPTVAYGIVYSNPVTGEIEEIGEQYSFTDTGIGVVDKCFLAGTKVLMADGNYKEIQTIKIGEKIKSYDTTKNKVVITEIDDIYQYDKEEMFFDFYYRINDNLKVTPNHRFYSNEKWVYADELKVGDKLFDPYFDYSVKTMEKIYKKESTFDLKIKNFYNYFVKADENVNILVHNGGLTQPIRIASPSEGAEWQMGTTQDIIWEYSGEGEPGTLLLFNDGLRVRETIASIEDLRIGSYQWSIGTTYTVDSNYYISIIGDLGASGKSSLFTLTSDTPIQYTLTMTETPSDGGSTIPSGSSDYDRGTIVNINANPAENYEFSRWNGDVSDPSSSSTTVTIDADKTVEAVFQKVSSNYRLTTEISPTNSGSITLDPSGGEYPSDTVVTATANPNEGYAFDHWEGNLSGSTNPESILMDSDKTITAVFLEENPDNYTLAIDITPSKSGTITPSKGRYVYNPDEVVNLNAEANSGWTFGKWYGDVADSSSPTTTITMNSNKYVTAIFETDQTFNTNISADFTMYDKDGLNPGRTICFNAKSSYSDVEINSYLWDFNNDGEFDQTTSIPVIEYTYEDDSIHYVKLKITDEYHNSDFCIKKVQANKMITPDIESDTDKVEISNKNSNLNTFEQDNENYYTEYTRISQDSNYYLYQIKNQKRSDYNILSKEKINNLEESLNSNYELIKNKIGLSEVYNFKVEIKDGNGNIISSAGAASSSDSLKRTIDKEILIYYPPEAQADGEQVSIQNPPIYKKGEISVSIFIGGIEPN